jgi:protein-disulfide isomerase
MSVDWKRRIVLMLTLGLCVLGGWLSEGLLELHDGTAGGASAAWRLVHRLCGPDGEESRGCSASARSAWSEVSLPAPGGPVNVPVAFLGVAYFVSLGAWFGLVGAGRAVGKPLGWVLLAVIGAGVYTTVLLFSLMALGRTPWCGGCAAIHLINIALVATVWAQHRMGSGAKVVNARQIAVVIALCALLIGTLYTSRRRRLMLLDEIADMRPYQGMVASLQSDPGLLMDAYLRAPKRDIAIRADERVPGTERDLVVFLDYECPACLATEAMIHGEIEDDFGGKLNVIVRHYPICTACNPNVPKTVHPDACRAAYAAEAARQLGGRPAFDRMTELLFANAPYLATSIGKEMAKGAGIDADQFVKLLDDPAVHQRVEEDVAEAHRLAVHDTPALFLDGRRVPDVCMSSGFWKAVARSN